LAIFGFNQFEADGFHVGAEIKGLDIERKGREIRHGASGFVIFTVVVHGSCASGSSVEVGGNFARNSCDSLRISTQLKKASGVSSQMRNQLAISSFSARLRGSTL